MSERAHSGSSLSESSPGLEPGVRAARVRAGLTQQEVADRLQVPIDTFRRWDRGTSQPRSPQRQRQLATVLDASLETLFPTEADPHVAVAMRRTRAAAVVGDGSSGAVGLGAGEVPGRATGSFDEGSGGEGMRCASRGDVGGGDAPRGCGPADAELARSAPLASPSDTASPAVTVERDVGDPWPGSGMATDDRSGDGGRPPSGVVLGLRGDHATSTSTPRSGASTHGHLPGARSRWSPSSVATRLRALVGAGAFALVIGMVVVLSGTTDDAVPEGASKAPRATANGVRETMARRIDVAERRGDFDLVMSLAFASGDRRSYDGARTAATDLTLDRASRALKAGHVRTAQRLVARVERRYGDPRPSRRASIADRIAAARKASRDARRRREAAAERQRPASGPAPQVPSAAPPSVARASSTEGTVSSASRPSQPGTSSSSSNSGGRSSSTSRSSGASGGRSPEFF